MCVALKNRRILILKQILKRAKTIAHLRLKTLNTQHSRTVLPSRAIHLKRGRYSFAKNTNRFGFGHPLKLQGRAAFWARQNFKRDLG